MNWREGIIHIHIKEKHAKGGLTSLLDPTQRWESLIIHCIVDFLEVCINEVVRHAHFLVIYLHEKKLFFKEVIKIHELHKVIMDVRDSKSCSALWQELSHLTGIGSRIFEQYTMTYHIDTMVLEQFESALLEDKKSWEGQTCHVPFLSNSCWRRYFPIQNIFLGLRYGNWKIIIFKIDYLGLNHLLILIYDKRGQIINLILLFWIIYPRRSVIFHVRSFVTSMFRWQPIISRFLGSFYDSLHAWSYYLILVGNHTAVIMEGLF